MPTIYIHAGTGKTGTTSIQHFFSVNREIILQETLLYYPETGIPDGKNDFLHKNLFPVSEEAWTSLKEEVSRRKITGDICL